MNHVSIDLFCCFCTQVEFFGGDAPVKNSDDGVLIVRYPNGRASGDAFVVFNNNEDMEAALAKNRGDMMGRYVELFKSSLKEFFLVCTLNLLCLFSFFLS